MHDQMTATETDRLCEWLIAHGHTAEEALQCIKYIAGNTATHSSHSKPTDSMSKEKAHRNADQSHAVS